MPFIHVELVEGRSDEAKKKIAQEIIESVHKHANAPKEHIHVIFQDMKKTDYYKKKKKKNGVHFNNVPHFYMIDT